MAKIGSGTRLLQDLVSCADQKPVSMFLQKSGQTFSHIKDTGTYVRAQLRSKIQKYIAWGNNKVIMSSLKESLKFSKGM
jgi:hypothetical protein